MRGIRLEEKFAIFGILVVILFSLGVLFEARVVVQYSPVNLDNQDQDIFSESQDAVVGSVDFIKEFFLKFSEEPARSYFVYTLLGILIILIILLLIRIKHRSQQTKSINKKYDRLNDAKVFVNQLRNNGYDDLIIRQMFIEKGWNELDIENIIM